MKHLILGILATLALAGSAFASDLTPRPRRIAEPIITPVYNWTGVYVGLNGGFAVGTQGASSNALSPLVPNDPADKMKGFLGGLQAGARWQVGDIVFGVRADIDVTDIKSRSASENTVRRTFLATQLADTKSMLDNGSKMSWLSTVTADVGVVVWQRALLSVRAGPAFGKISWDNTQAVATNTLSPLGVAFCAGGVISCPNLAATTATDSKWKAGWTAGTSLEIALGKSMSFISEVDYVSLGRGGGALGEQKFDVWLTKLGINVRL